MSEAGYQAVNTAAELKQVRKRLRRALTQLDTSGWRFEQVFACKPSEASLNPYIRLRVELRFETNELLKYHVWVDYHLPLGAEIEDVERFKKAVIAASRKALWAHALVDELRWQRRDLQ